MAQDTTLDLLDQDDAIDSRIGVHDKSQFEVKLDYAIDPDRRRSRYRVDAYFFVPTSLGINPATYGKDQFFADVQAYIRFKTPALSIAALLDPANTLSPLQRLESAIERIARDPRAAEREAVAIRTELRLLGCLLRAHVRDRAISTRAAIRELGDDDPAERSVLVGDLRGAIESLVDETTTALERFRALRGRFLACPQAIAEAYLYVDEYLSLAIEDRLTSMIATLDPRRCLREALGACRSRLVDAVVAEQQHRRGAGYRTVLEGGEAGGEYFVYRKGVLKKFVMSVLFLEIRKQKEGRKLAQLIAAIAAAVAMLFAAVLTIWSTNRWGADSFPFVVAVVITYIFKDRIKDGLKTFVTGRMGEWLYDYNVRIRDPEQGTTLGRCREVFSFVRPNRVPREVVARRYADAEATIEPLSKPEVVMRYGKQVAIGNAPGRMQDLNDIIRFNVASFLTRMDDATQPVRAYSAARDSVETLTLPKTYHLNVVFVLRAIGGNGPTIQRIRVILDRTGIRRIEDA